MRLDVYAKCGQVTGTRESGSAYLSQWVILPTKPSGQRGAPRSPGNTDCGGSPSAVIAERAQTRTAANSRRRFSTEQATAAASSGHRGGNVTGVVAVHLRGGHVVGQQPSEHRIPGSTDKARGRTPQPDSMPKYVTEERVGPRGN